MYNCTQTWKADKECKKLDCRISKCKRTLVYYSSFVTILIDSAKTKALDTSLQIVIHIWCCLSNFPKHAILHNKKVYVNIEAMKLKPFVLDKTHEDFSQGKSTSYTETRQIMVCAFLAKVA